MRTSSPPIGCRRAVSNGRAGAMAAEVAAAPPRRVQVCVRLRPGPPGEEPCLLPLDSHTLELREEPPSAPSRYRFDAIYGAASSTATVYEGSVRPLLSHLLAGRDVTVLAYGPSGSGKTHTMLGSEGEPGLVQRALEDVLEAVGDSRRVTVACMEVYCEEIRDLLCPGGPPLRILQARGGPPEVRGLTRLPLGPPPAPALLAASLGARRRAAPTLLNASSSRGHLVLWVRCDPPGTPPAPGGAPPPPTLTLADLAGLEDPRRSGAGGVRLREGGATNASLGVLRRVLGALRRGGRPPLRESRLTRLLGGAPRPPGPPLLLLLLALCPRPPGRPQARRALSFARGVRHVPPPPVGDEGGDATVASNAPEPRSPPSTPPPEDQALQRWLEDAENTLQAPPPRPPWWCCGGGRRAVPSGRRWPPPGWRRGSGPMSCGRSTGGTRRSCGGWGPAGGGASMPGARSTAPSARWRTWRRCPASRRRRWPRCCRCPQAQEVALSCQGGGPKPRR
ncbi:kinesin-like protein KIF22 isoform X13 [Cygnus olor]|uniref:kinesin-like protein KIF22 isoform X13 n=1 Tax=Cygnus olor TaxID=8869 RepID=UPI001ADE59D2|nr:kinesin-like protein KIF22 isoform X13 [Cygnus olor]